MVTLENSNLNFRSTINTNSSGIAHFSGINEGRYQLTVQKINHGGHRSIVVVEDQGTNVTVFIPRQVVSYTWVVVPTEIEDKYVFVLEATFETNVPIPGMIFTWIIIILILLSILSSDHCGTFSHQYR
jgi:hypothetical protein